MIHDERSFETYIHVSYTLMFMFYISLLVWMTRWWLCLDYYKICAHERSPGRSTIYFDINFTSIHKRISWENKSSVRLQFKHIFNSSLIFHWKISFNNTHKTHPVTNVHDQKKKLHERPALPPKRNSTHPPGLL